VLAVAAALVFVLCLLSCLAAVGKIRSVDGERSKVEKQVRESQMVAQTERSSENKYLDTRAQIRCLESSVSTQSYVPTLLKQIEHLGKSVHLKVLGVRPKAADPNVALAKKQATQAAAQNGQAGADGAVAAATPPPAKPYDQIEVELELEGNYMNALDFLYKLTSFPKILAVNSVQMNPGSGLMAAESPRLSIKINATAFVFKEASPSKGKPLDGAAKAPGGRGNEAG
jgi:Tfp pilus assembly protein PilO